MKPVKVPAHRILISMGECYDSSMGKTQKNSIRIGSASAFWGDSTASTPQLIHHGDIDYLIYDYLSEVTLALLARNRLKNPEQGYIAEFLETLSPFLKDIQQKKIKVISNAGALNPLGLKKKIEEQVQAQGLNLKVIAVSGDDLMQDQNQLLTDNKLQLEATPPSPLLTCNAYLGAFPIVEALKQEAQIIICGRHVDSAHALAPLICEFQWEASDFDRLSAGSLVGHLLECGAQSTGGNFTDWKSIPDPYDIGYPIAICQSNGDFTLTKPSNTGGLVSTSTLAEQLVYEVGDPKNYLLPDVTCDWTGVHMKDVGNNEVFVTGAKGKEASPYLKVVATSFSDFRTDATIYLAGLDAYDKAISIAENIKKKVDRIIQNNKFKKINKYQTELLGSLNSPEKENCKEIILRMSAVSEDSRSLDIFSKEIAPAATNLAPGVCNLLGGRPRSQPRVQLLAGKLWKNKIGDFKAEEASYHQEQIAQDWNTELPLFNLALARSGDKGAHVNIGIIARDPNYLPFIKASLTEEAIKSHLEKWVHHFQCQKISFYDWSGIHGINILIHNTLSQGGLTHLAIDPQGKSYAQHLLSIPILVSKKLKGELWQL